MKVELVGAKVELDGESAMLQLLIAEFEWVAGLIRYYREVELKALGATGLVLSAVAAAYAALGESKTPTRTEGVVLAGAAVVTALILVVVLMAVMRGWRAARYVREHLHARAKELTGGSEDYLAWELAGVKNFTAGVGAISKNIRKIMVSAFPVLLLGTLASVALAVAAHQHDPTLTTDVLALASIVVAAMCYLQGLVLVAHREDISRPALGLLVVITLAIAGASAVAWFCLHAVTD